MLQELRIPETRLVTITGPPGVGKTRLALEVASRLLHEFEHGAFWVDLVPINDPALVPYTVARVLGIWQSSSIAADHARPLLDRLREYLQSKQLLLLLDNFEHVIGAATELAALLESCPNLKILATSREPLKVRWEREVPLAPLPLPDLLHLPTVETLAEYPAIRLFVERARAVRPDFVLNEHNARTVAEICSRLDGLPLAIELAAPFLRVLSEAALLKRLHHRLRLLRGTLRDLPVRHQTLRAAIAWSYELLDPAEQLLFRRLSVFAGGSTLEAAAEVCQLNNPETGLLDDVAALASKALLRRADGDDVVPRFSMLDSIREFGLEKLVETSELEEAQRRHAAYFLALAKRAEPECLGPDQATWLDRLEQEHNNFRAALHWSIRRADAETALRLAGTLTWFWNVRCHWTEGCVWLERGLSITAGVAPSVRAKALFGAGFLAAQLYDISRANGLLEASLALYTDLGDEQGCTDALYGLGYLAYLQRDHQGAASALNNSLAIARRLGDERRTATTLYMLGSSAFNQEKFELATGFLQESRALSHKTGHIRTAANSLRLLGYIALVDGSLAKAGTFLSESLALFRAIGDRRGTADDLHTLGWVAVRQGNYRRAVDLLEESLVICLELDDKPDLIEGLEAVTDLAIRCGRMEQAALLLGGTEALREATGFPPSPLSHDEIQRRKAVIQSALGAQAVAEPQTGDQTSSLDGIIEQALKVLHSPLLTTDAASTRKSRRALSRREREVANLIARGLSNREIAAALFVGERTAEFHVQGILNKLGLRSRVQIAAWAMQPGRAATPGT